jgi:hypothetical protein
MNKAELKANVERAMTSWIDQVFCDECSDMEEFTFTVEVRRCEHGNIRCLEVLQECRPARHYEEDDEDYPEPDEGCEVEAQG